MQLGRKLAEGYAVDREAEVATPAAVERLRDTERTDAERVDAERVDAERVDADRIDAERVDRPVRA